MSNLDEEIQDAIDRGEMEPREASATLYDLVEIVRQSRERTNDVFPLPDVDSCIDYAITEAGEFLDAVLREKRDTDKRNRDKDHDARKELSQCGYMICSAIIQIDGVQYDRKTFDHENVYDLFYFLSMYRLGGLWFPDYDPTNEYAATYILALNAYCRVCESNGWNPADLLRETCAAFEAKHLPLPRGYDFEPVGKLFRYPVLSAEEAAKQGEQAE